MDSVYDSLAPLSPFTWYAREDATAETAANAVLHDIALLDLRFDLILDEFAVPCHHTLHLINDGRPLQRKSLTLRQLQLLQYGLVVHEATRLVAVAVPPCCGDSGACLAASYEHLFSRPLDTASAVAEHPLLPEYTFIVYRLPEKQEDDVVSSPVPPPQQQRPEALFRFVYRNVNPNTAMGDFDAAAAPEYKLVAVLVSSSTYYGELQRVMEYRQAWAANAAANRASGGDGVAAGSADVLRGAAASLPLPEPIAAEVRASSSLSKLCSCLARVLERFTPVDGINAVGAAVTSEANDGGIDAAAEEEEDVALSNGASPPPKSCTPLPGRDPWSYQYTCDGPRLVRRLDVVERTKKLLQAWRDGELDVTDTVVSRTPLQNGNKVVVMSAHSTHPPLTLQPLRAPCARLLLLPSHHEVSTQITENEIVSFLPKDDVPADVATTNITSSSSAPNSPSASTPSAGGFGGVVYASPAAERLRRWILQGLIAAEVHGVHAVLLDLDPVSLLQPCVELLSETAVEDSAEAGDAPESEDVRSAQMRYKRALLLVCQVAVETVERFVRHSGLVWKVTVAVRETTADGVPEASTSPCLTAWCADVLNLLRAAEVQREASAQQNTLSFVDKDDEAASAQLIAVANGDALALRAGNDGAELNTLSASQQLALRTQAVVDRALLRYTYESSGPAAPLPSHITAKAKTVGLNVRDADMYALFTTFCAAAKRRDQHLPVSALVDLLTEEWAPAGGAKRRRYTTATPRLVSPLDSCGIPVTRPRVQRFLQPFLDVMRDPSRSSSYAVFSGPTSSDAQTLNYAQFSMVMFAIAKM